MYRLYAALVVLFCATHLNYGKEMNSVISMSQNPDQGSFTSCGPKESNFLLQWSPRVLQTGIDLLVDITLKLVDSFDHGVVTVTVWLQGVPDPIYQDSADQKCEDAAKAVEKYMPGFNCPLPKGYGISLQQFTFHIAPTIPLPSGKFHINATVMNQNNVMLFCAFGDVEAQDE